MMSKTILISQTVGVGIFSRISSRPDITKPWSSDKNMDLRGFTTDAFQHTE